MGMSRGNSGTGGQRIGEMGYSGTGGQRWVGMYRVQSVQRKACRAL